MKQGDKVVLKGSKIDKNLRVYTIVNILSEVIVKVECNIGGKYNFYITDLEQVN